MGNHGGIGKAEVRISVGLIGGLLAILVTAIVHRSSHHPVVDGVPTATSRFVADGEVVPAEFHAKAGAPVVLKPRGSLPPPVYAAETSPAAVAAGPAQSADPMTLASDAPAAGDFMPKLPATESPGNAPNPAVPTGRQPPRDAPVTMPEVDDRPATLGHDGPPAIYKPTAEAPPEADEAATLGVAMPAGPPPADAAPRVVPSPVPSVGTAEEQGPPARDTAKPIAVTQTPVPLASPMSRDTDAIAQNDPPSPTDSPAGQHDQLRGDDHYTVRPGDSMWSIAKKVYGTGTFFQALVEHNRAVHSVPEHLAAGDQVLTPPVGLLRAKYPHLCPRPTRTTTVSRQATPTANSAAPAGSRRYLAEEGDSLAIIARYELGDVNRWSEIYQLNRSLLGNHPESLQPGTWLILPPAVNSSAVARQQLDR